MHGVQRGGRVGARVQHLNDVVAILALHRLGADFPLFHGEGGVGECGDHVTFFEPAKVATVLCSTALVGRDCGCQFGKVRTALELFDNVVGFGFGLDQNMACVNFLLGRFAHVVLIIILFDGLIRQMRHHLLGQPCVLQGIVCCGLHQLLGIGLFVQPFFLRRNQDGFLVCQLVDQHGVDQGRGELAHLRRHGAHGVLHIGNGDFFTINGGDNRIRVSGLGRSRRGRRCRSRCKGGSTQHGGTEQGSGCQPERVGNKPHRTKP